MKSVILLTFVVFLVVSSLEAEKNPQNPGENSNPGSGKPAPENKPGETSGQENTAPKRPNDQSNDEKRRELENFISSARDRLKTLLEKGKQRMDKTVGGKLTKQLQKLGDRQNGKKASEEELDGSGEPEDNNMEEKKMDGMKQNASAVTIDEVRILLSNISSLADRVNTPLSNLKPELIDSEAATKDDKALSLLLQKIQEEYVFPTTQIKMIIESCKDVLSRLFQAGYENDIPCDNFQRAFREMRPENGELPESFPEKFVDALQMSVSCLVQDYERFSKDLALVQELDEGSSADEVYAAISKAMLGGLRLKNKMAEQDRIIAVVRGLLPDAEIIKEHEFKRLLG